MCQQVKQDNFFKTCPIPFDAPDSDLETCFSCILGMAYAGVAHGDLTPFFSELVNQASEPIRPLN